jgi:hypothetical protein
MNKYDLTREQLTESNKNVRGELKIGRNNKGGIQRET